MEELIILIIGIAIYIFWTLQFRDSMNEKKIVGFIPRTSSTAWGGYIVICVCIAMAVSYTRYNL